ncbi:sensor domain-containing diguanylate cyclase [Pseudomonas sp. UBA2684]|uniref:sensor domain-containing diguanylate cyclase n=1 Tax=Pseudomonas sp. UBA2684 TaxID=1947311 RepID=UPI000E883DFC|nr:diguanylate cyclase [Pseudomonas sp. UBA2684]HBX57443.1 sensor domain-containing diguanylate cyclase [Pseudomonas sp.]|tara:strand:- start:534 stop:2384 length:1851 start_codon:yes stop_codon:yes gene_type:complete
MPQRLQSLWPARLALAALLLSLCLASLLLWQQLVIGQQQRVAERVSYQARSLARQLESSLNDQVDGLRRIAQLWNHRGRIPKDEWRLDSQLSLNHFKGYQAIQWLGADLRMRWIEPLSGNEAAQNFRLTPTHPNFNLAMQAKTLGEPRFSNSFALVQGGHGFVLYTPLYIRDEQAERVFDGFMQGVFRVEQLMDELLTHLDSSDFSAYLLENGQPIYSRERTDALDGLQQEVPLHLLNNQSFALQLKPSQQLVGQLTTPLPEIVLGASLIISLLLVAALALALENARRASALQLSNRRLNQEVGQREQVEQVLRDSRERLQLVLDLTDSSRDGLFIIDPHSRDILHMNQATYRSLGYSAEAFSQLLKQDPEQLLPGFNSWLDGVRQAHQDNLSMMFQRQMRRRDGSNQAAEISAQLVLLNGHEYLIGVSRDNSERLQLEAQLQRLSQQDGLTGLYNRRFFDNQLASEWRRLRRQGAPLTLLMLDIDFFKAYNDQLGHLAGDDALRRVAQVLQDALQREGDTACRYGGEEFAIILANTGLDGGNHVAEQVHQRLAELHISHPASPLGRLSLSIGLACVDLSEEILPDTLIAQSDQALYQAKREGRNRTCVWRPDNPR